MNDSLCVRDRNRAKSRCEPWYHHHRLWPGERILQSIDAIMGHAYRKQSLRLMMNVLTDEGDLEVQEESLQCGVMTGIFTIDDRADDCPESFAEMTGGG